MKVSQGCVTVVYLSPYIACQNSAHHERMRTSVAGHVFTLVSFVGRVAE